MSHERYEVRPIGHVRSPVTDLASAPKQGDEGAPEAWLVFDEALDEAYRDLRPGDLVVVLTWLHLARRDVLSVHPRDDRSRPRTGVLSTRSSERPNPIGLHPVEILAVDGERVKVSPLEAIDGTPVVDVKPVLAPTSAR